MPQNKLHQLMSALEAAPAQSVQGVVHPLGVGASKSPGDEYWHMTFSLSAWRVNDGPIHETKLTMRRDISDDELEFFQNHLPCYGVVSLQAGLIEHPDFGSGAPQALLRSIATDRRVYPDLMQIADALQRPAITEDAQFGPFTLDRRLAEHEAQTHWGETPVRLYLDSEDGSEEFPHESLLHARRLWSEHPRWNQEIQSVVIDKLLTLKNEVWLEEDEAPLSADQFWAQTTIETIYIYTNGSFEFWLNDGDTFGGHSIMASGSFEEGINDAGIHG